MFQVDVALGLFNGAKYLSDFLVSLQEQKFRNWRLVVRDDGSSDNSLAIVKAWAEKHSRPLKIVSDSRGNLGVVGNFSECLRNTDATYVMPADQDDVWFSTKIEVAVAEIQRLENQHGEITPIAVYCDLQVVDAQLIELYPSFLAMQGQHMRRLPTLPQLLAQNVAPGCSMIVNRALLNMALPIPEQAAMHDWWLMLLACAQGHIGHIRNQGLAYRQHEANQVGAKRGGIGALLMQSIKGTSVYKYRLQRSQRQALALAKYLPPDSPHQPLLQFYGNLSKYPLIIRQVRAWRAGFSKVGYIRNFAFYILM